MFFCCCPKKSKPHKPNNIDEKLIQVPDSPRKPNSQQKYGALSDSERKKQPSNFSQKSHPISHADKTNSHHQNKQPFSHMSGDESSLGVKPFFNDNPMTPTLSGMSSKNIGKTKWQLFDFEHNTEVVYFDTKKGDEFCIRYVINKKPNGQKQSKLVLNYVLAKKSQKNVDETELILVIPSKPLYETKHIQIPDNVYAVFTNIKRQQKSNFTNVSSQMIEIIDGDQGSIKTSAFDKIIIMMEREQDLEFIKNYCRELAKRYTLDEFLKIWWVFPAFVNLQDISDIIKQTLRKFLINQRVQNASKYLYYEIIVIKQFNLEPFIMVRNKRWNQVNNLQVKKHSKDYESQICMAIGLVMVEMNESVLPYYKYFLENTLFDMKFLDYVKYKSLLQNEKENFFKKLIFYNLVTDEGAKVLEDNRKMIEFKYENQDHRRFCLKSSAKKKFVAAFGFQESAHTGQGNTPVRQQWDDNLRIQDLQVRKGSWDKQSNDSPDNDLNLIDEQELDNILLGDLIGLDNDEAIESQMSQSQQNQLKLSSKPHDQQDELDINIFQTKQA